MISPPIGFSSWQQFAESVFSDGDHCFYYVNEQSEIEVKNDSLGANLSEVPRSGTYAKWYNSFKYCYYGDCSGYNLSSVVLDPNNPNLIPSYQIGKPSDPCCSKNILWKFSPWKNLVGSDGNLFYRSGNTNPDPQVFAAFQVLLMGDPKQTDSSISLVLGSSNVTGCSCEPPLDSYKISMCNLQSSYFSDTQTFASRLSATLGYESISTVGPTNLLNFIDLAHESSLGPLALDSLLEQGHTYYLLCRMFVVPAENGTWYDNVIMSSWGRYKVVVNTLPIITETKLNDEMSGATPVRISKNSNLYLGFTVKDYRLLPSSSPINYRIQVGNYSNYQFIPTWDTGKVVAASSQSLTNSIGDVSVTQKVSYAGVPLVEGATQYWRVQGSDWEPGDWSVPMPFVVNTKPRINSITANGNETLYVALPTTSSDNVTIAWNFYSPTSTQYGYKLKVGVNTDGDILDVEENGDRNSVLIPILPDNSVIKVSLTAWDDLDSTSEYSITFKTNGRPSVRNLKVDSKENPHDLTTTTPTFSWAFYDPDSSDYQHGYRIQVASDSSFASLVWDTGDLTGATSNVVYGSTPAPVVGPVALSHSVQQYYGRIKVYDGLSWSDYSDLTCQCNFAINHPPNDPTLIRPVAGSYSDILRVEWVPASPLDQDGDTITYALEITSQQSMGKGWGFLAGPISETETFYDVDLSDIPSGSDYGIRIIASDGMDESDPSNGGESPRFTISNHAPVSPVFINPKSGDSVSMTLTVEWVEANVVDIDGDSVSYILDITNDFSVTAPVWNRIGYFSQGITQAQINISDYEDGSHYNLRIVAIDEHGLNGTYQYSGEFSIINSLSVSDFERINGELLVGTKDGRVLRASESFWQVDEDWSSGYSSLPFDVYKSGTPDVSIIDGKLVIKPGQGSTFLYRQTNKKGNIT